ncbi:hypothetical protein diail_8046 [Diaporthe ilicicola]|nr:hypothetical protein diail_8046 [Diaporthe ilicicola]
MDDRSQDDASSPAPSHGGEGEAPAASARLEESPMFVEQEDDMSAEPKEPGGTNTPEQDNTQSPELVDQNEGDPEQAAGAHSEQGGNDEEAAQEGDGTDGSEDDDAGGSGSDNDSVGYNPATCTRACRQQAKDAAKQLEIANKKIEKREDEIKKLRNDLAKAREEIARLKRRLGIPVSPRSNEKSWSDKLRQHLDLGEGSYEDVWQSSYKALNISIKLDKVHPQVRLIPKGDDEDSDLGQDPPVEPILDQDQGQDQGSRSRIPQLPDSILCKILTELLTMDGLVHCFSRLDPFCAPVDFPTENELGNSSTGIRGRFFISKARCSDISLTHDTENPQTVLAVLSVSRKLSWLSTHIFYGTNTFAFSSISEFERWANGSGSARIARVQHIEITWTGGRSLAFDLGRAGGIDRKANLPLSWLCEATSLKTLCVHISETAKNHIRRRREPASMKQYMKRKTAGQPNYRMTRSLRNCRGMDNIYQLRGLHWVRWLDLDKECADPTADRSLLTIRDKSFAIDVERVTTQKKVPLRLENSRLEALDRLWPNRPSSWTPSREHFDVIRHIYTNTTGYDSRRNDLDEDVSSTPSDADSPDSDDDADDDDNSGPALQTPPGSSRRSRPFTPAPGSGASESEELSESETNEMPNEDGENTGSEHGDADNDGEKGDEKNSDDAAEAFCLNRFLRDNSELSEIDEEDKESHGDDEGSPPYKMESASADEFNDIVPLNTGTKRARPTSPVSEGALSGKRLKSRSGEYRLGSVPMQTWAFPEEA